MASSFRGPTPSSFMEIDSHEFDCDEGIPCNCDERCGFSCPFLQWCLPSARGSNRNGPSWWWLVYCSSWCTFQGILGIAYCPHQSQGVGWLGMTPPTLKDFGFGHFSPFSRLRPSLDLYYTLLEILKETGEKSVLHQSQWVSPGLSWSLGFLFCQVNAHSGGPCRVCGDPTRRQI